MSIYAYTYTHLIVLVRVFEVASFCISFSQPVMKNYKRMVYGYGHWVCWCKLRCVYGLCYM
ncbi:hypothetical protein EON63_08405 [archaeon]|nr:MAG: hypothetical protein EON63_08405 [archaeon]